MLALALTPDQRAHALDTWTGLRLPGAGVVEIAPLLAALAPDLPVQYVPPQDWRLVGIRGSGTGPVALDCALTAGEPLRIGQTHLAVPVLHRKLGPRAVSGYEHETWVGCASIATLPDGTQWLFDGHHALVVELLAGLAPTCWPYEGRDTGWRELAYPTLPRQREP